MTYTLTEIIVVLALVLCGSKAVDMEEHGKNESKWKWVSAIGLAFMGIITFL